MMDWISFTIGSGVAVIINMSIDWMMDIKKQNKIKQTKHEEAVNEIFELFKEIDDRLIVLEKKRR